MKDTYILIAYRPETYVTTCSCCPGETYEHDYQLHQFEDLDQLADRITAYAIRNTNQKKYIDGYHIWIIYNGEFIIGEPDCDYGRDPRKKLFDIDNFTYDSDKIEKEMILENILKSLDEKIDQKWRLDEERKKEKERIKNEKERIKAAEEKKLREMRKAENERKKLKELAEKYPEELK